MPTLIVYASDKDLLNWQSTNFLNLAADDANPGAVSGTLHLENYIDFHHFRVNNYTGALISVPANSEITSIAMESSFLGEYGNDPEVVGVNVQLHVDQVLKGDSTPDVGSLVKKDWNINSGWGWFPSAAELNNVLFGIRWWFDQHSDESEPSTGVVFFLKLTIEYDYSVVIATKPVADDRLVVGEEYCFEWEIEGGTTGFVVIELWKGGEDEGILVHTVVSLDDEVDITDLIYCWIILPPEDWDAPQENPYVDDYTIVIRNPEEGGGSGDSGETPDPGEGDFFEIVAPPTSKGRSGRIRIITPRRSAEVIL